MMVGLVIYLVATSVARIVADAGDVSLLQLRGADTCRPPGVFVVGASRSGTSVTTSLLARVGLNLGKAKGVGSGSGHPDGINEWKEVVSVNRKAWPGKWSDTPQPLSSEVLSSGLVGEATATLQQLVQDTDCQPWVVKDPRLVVTLPLWARAASDAGLNFAVLLVSREPITNAESLFRHQSRQAPFVDPLLRWQRMNELALEGSQPYPRHLIHYSDLVSNTQRDATLHSLVAWLNGAGIPAALPAGGVDDLIVSHDEPISKVNQPMACGGRANPRTCVLSAAQAALAERLRAEAALSPAPAPPALLERGAAEEAWTAELAAAASRTRKGCGIILSAFGPKYADRALRTAEYLRGLDLPPGWCADEGEEEVHAKITIFTDVLPLPSHGDGIQVVYLPAAAGALAERTFPVPGAAPRYQASPAVWWKRIVGLLNSPYMLTLALDLDCLPRTGAAAGEAFAQLRDADLFTAEAPVPFGGSFGAAAAPAPPGLTAAEAASWAAFPERNLGLVGWNFRRAAARGVALDFARAFARELQGGAAVRGDQTAFREALFEHRGRGLREHRCDGATCCRWRADAACAWVHGRGTARALLHD